MMMKANQIHHVSQYMWFNLLVERQSLPDKIKSNKSCIYKKHVSSKMTSYNAHTHTQNKEKCKQKMAEIIFRENRIYEKKSQTGLQNNCFILVPGTVHNEAKI